jgi:dienelactone hydrolase
MYMSAFSTICLLLAGCALPEPPRGLLGPYQLDTGETVSISRSNDGSLRYRMFENGKSGRLYLEADQTYVSGDGFSQKEPLALTVEFQVDERRVARTLSWTRVGDATTGATRVGTERYLSFASDGARFHARLQLPEGPPPYPAVVLIHGSGSSPGTEWFYNSDFFAASGIAALTYDKRGSGRSEGEFTFDFEQLARDAVAAVNTLSEQPEIDVNKIGLSGYSQGGWVAPLASSMSESIQFVIVNYGLIESPAEEARLEMMQLLSDASVSDEDLADADLLIRAAVNLVANNFESGWSEFDTFEDQYGDAQWMKYLDGTPVDELVSYPKFLINWLAKSRLPKGLQWQYDSTELLESSDTAMVWLLAEADRSAPNSETIAKLRAWEASDKPFRLTLFPDADHGMLTFDEVDGERIYREYAPGYFQAEIDAVRISLSHTNRLRLEVSP